MKSARLLSIAYNSYTKPKSHESSRYNLWLYILIINMYSPSNLKMTLKRTWESEKKNEDNRRKGI